MTMKISPYRLKLREKKIKRARRLYKQGLTIRDVAELVEMSRGWVHSAVRDLSTA